MTTNIDIRKGVNSEMEVGITQDKGWAWIVLIGAFLSVITSHVPVMCFGLLYRPLFERFDVSSSSISWLFNVTVFVWNTFTITLGPLCEAFGWRSVAITGAIFNSAAFILSFFVSRFEQLFFVHSVLVGIGGSIGLGTSFIVVSNYFKKRRGFAMAITTTGVCVCLFLGPPTVLFLQKEYTPKGAFLITGALLLHAIAGGMLFRPNSVHPKPKKNATFRKVQQSKVKLPECEKCDLLPNNSDIIKLLKKNPQTEESVVEQPCEQSFQTKMGIVIKSVILNTAKSFKHLSNKRIVIICVATPFLFLGYVNFQLWIPFAVVDYGHSMELASLIMSAAGITNAFGRLCSCALADYSKISNIAVYNAGVLFVSLSILMFATFNSVAALVVSVCIWGFSLGIAMAMYPVVIIEVVGVNTFPIAYGLASLFAGVELLIFGPIIGMVKDSSPTFQIPLTLMSVLVLVAFVAWLFMPMAQRYDAKIIHNIKEKNDGPRLPDRV